MGGAGAAAHPQVTSNSFLAVCAHLRSGDWASIVPHGFLHLFGDTDLVAIDLIEPVHSEAVGLVISKTEPRSLMADALLRASLSALGSEAFAAL